MSKSWLLDYGISIAREIKASGLHSANHLQDNGDNSKCSQCTYGINNSNESNKWMGLPSGVKFDPSDIELLEHLAAKCGTGSATPQQYIDVFIPTLDVEEGICSKHPQDLPGSRTDGNNFHFFSRTTKAYTTGQRKRRKICNESSSTSDVRWHKTGKTKPIFKNGAQIGFKKILVLYETVVRGSKPCKKDWVMHQYHLGPDEEEKDGEYVVSKIFYQIKNQIDPLRVVVKESDASISLTSPGTPLTNVPHPPRPGNTPVFEDDAGDYVLQQPSEESECFEQKYLPSFSPVELQDELREDDLQAIDSDTFDFSFLSDDYQISTKNIVGTSKDTSLETTALDNLYLGSSLDFTLADLYFPAEDSFNGWLDRL